MTWSSDAAQGRAAGEEREKLLAQREKLIKEIEELKVKPIGSRSQAAINGRKEDLLELARQVLIVDRKLGRT